MRQKALIKALSAWADSEEKVSSLLPADGQEDALTEEENALRMAMLFLKLAMNEVSDLHDPTVDAANPGKRLAKVVKSIHKNYARLSRSFDEMRQQRGQDVWLSRW